MGSETVAIERTPGHEAIKVRTEDSPAWAS